jgi:hypothetical protein
MFKELINHVISVHGSKKVLCSRPKNYFQGDSRPFKETHAQGDSLWREQGESSLAARLERARGGQRERERLREPARRGSSRRASGERETKGTSQERELVKRMVS